jgi:hypothetical protein
MVVEGVVEKVAVLEFFFSNVIDPAAEPDAAVYAVTCP